MQEIWNYKKKDESKKDFKNRKKEEKEKLKLCEKNADKIITELKITDATKEAEIAIRDGYIDNCRVYTKQAGIFQNTEIINNPLDYPIDSVKLINIKNPSYVIFLKDIFTYLPDYDYLNFVPKDTVLKLTVAEPNANLTFNSNLNAYLDFRIYTDLFALLNNESNGLIQTEVASPIIYNRFRAGKRLYIINYFEPSFKISKLDNTNRYIETNDTLKPYDVNPLSVNQKSYVEVGLKMNLIKYKFLQNVVELNVGLNYNFTDLKFMPNENIEAVNSWYWYFEERLKLLKFNNFGLDMAFIALNQKILNSNVEENEFWNTYLLTSFELFYHPLKNPGNKIFLRFKEVYSADGFGNYPLLQFGFSSQLKYK